MAIKADYIGIQISIEDIQDCILKEHHCYLFEKIVDCVDFSKWGRTLGY